MRNPCLHSLSYSYAVVVTNSITLENEIQILILLLNLALINQAARETQDTEEAAARVQEPASKKMGPHLLN